VINDYVTYCAQAKLLRFMEERGAASIRLTAHRDGGVSIEPSQSVVCKLGDVILNATPRIYTDLRTLLQLKQASIDFSYPSAEFIITRDKHDHQSHDHQR